MLSDYEREMISNLFKTEWGQALEKWLREEISIIEERESNNLRISDDPLHEDFRWQMGMKIGLKMVLNKPRDCFNELKK